MGGRRGWTDGGGISLLTNMLASRRAEAHANTHTCHLQQRASFTRMYVLARRWVGARRTLGYLHMAGLLSGVWVRVLWVSAREREKERKHLLYFWNDWSCTAAVNKLVVAAAGKWRSADGAVLPGQTKCLPQHVIRSGAQSPLLHQGCPWHHGMTIIDSGVAHAAKDAHPLL